MLNEMTMNANSWLLTFLVRLDVWGFVKREMRYFFPVVPLSLLSNKYLFLILLILLSLGMFAFISPFTPHVLLISLGPEDSSLIFDEA